MEPGNGFRQQNLAPGRPGPDPQDTFLVLGNVAKLPPHGLVSLQKAFGVLEQSFAAIGELQWHMAYDQLAAQLFFKTCDMSAQRLLCQVQSFRRPGKVPFLTQDLKVFQG